MRAVIVNEYGETPVVAEVPTPQVGPGQVLIRLQAAGVNPLDSVLASGDWRPAPATFPMVLGVDGAGVVAQAGEGVTGLSVGDEAFGQLLIAPIGSTGTYAEYVAVSENAPLARVPHGLDPAVAAALPTAGMTGLSVVDSLERPEDKTVLIVGAGGGVGSFATQFAVGAGARVIANAPAAAAERMRSYGAIESIDHTEVSLPEAVRRGHPDGIDALVDLADDADGFNNLASLVRRGGTAITTRYVADAESLQAKGVTAVNFALQASSELLRRVADAVVERRIAAPPITRVSLADAPAAATSTNGQLTEGKIVIIIQTATQT